MANPEVPVTTLSAQSIRKAMYANLPYLTKYAKKLFQYGDTLSVPEEEDRKSRMENFLAMGILMELTYSEMVSLILKESLLKRRGCDCPDCQVRLTSDRFDPDESFRG